MEATSKPGYVQVWLPEELYTKIREAQAQPATTAPLAACRLKFSLAADNVLTIGCTGDCVTPLKCTLVTEPGGGMTCQCL